MTLTERILEVNIFVDFGFDPFYGWDQMDVDYPCRFATVMFQLMNTSLLSQIADRIRVTEGYRPMSPMDGYSDSTCDQEGWYSFYYGINALGAGIGDSTIEFCVENSDSDDNEEMYTIDLSDAERDAMYLRMDEQCRKYLGEGCKELLTEANKQLQEQMEFEAEDKA